MVNLILEASGLFSLPGCAATAFDHRLRGTRRSILALSPLRPLDFGDVKPKHETVFGESLVAELIFSRNFLRRVDC